MVYSYGEAPQDVLLTLEHREVKYELPVHLAGHPALTGAGPIAAVPRVPLMLAWAWGPLSPKPVLRFSNRNGNTIPVSVVQGSARVSGMSGSSREQLTVAIAAGVFNSRTGTCSYVCTYCDGRVIAIVSPDGFGVAVDNQQGEGGKVTTFCRLGLAVTLLASGFFSFGSGARQEASPPHWTLSPSTLRVSSGGEIEIRVTARDTAGTGLDLDGLHAEDTYPPREFTVLNSRGDPAPLTALGRQWEHVVLAGSAGIWPHAQPGQSVTELLVLSRFFDLTIPGAYTVWFSAQGTISNKITVTVVQ